MDEPILLETKLGPLRLHVCKDGNLENDGWTEIYMQSFPPAERQDLNELKFFLQESSMELDETRDEQNRILCMTITEIFRPRHMRSPFLLACYTAVVPEFRGLGIGSIHRRKLAALLGREYQNYVGIFTEIESTRVEGLSEADMETRTKRKRFFLKLGLQPLDVDYYFPNSIPGAEPIAGELLWLPFDQSMLSLPEEVLSDIIQRIYEDGYGLRADDPLIVSTLAKF